MRGAVVATIAVAACGDDGGMTSGDVNPPMADAPLIGATSCDPLPMPSGNIIDVTPAQADQLGTIALGASPGDVIRLADGTYNITAGVGMNLSKPGLTVISASRDASKVTLDGGAYVSRELIQITASNVTVAHITLKNARNHPIHLYPGAGADITGAMIYGVVIIDGGQQFIKSNPDKSNAEVATAHFVDDVTVACSTFTMTAAGRAYVPINPDNTGYPCYTGGIDAHSAKGWLVRRNRFEGIYCDSGLAEHAIHFWHCGRDQLIEQNGFVNNARAIGLGLTDGAGFNERPYADNPHAADKMGAYAGNYDGMIRNNFIFADVSAFDCGICLEQAMGAKVIANTVVRTGMATTGNAVEYRFANSLVTIDNTIATSIVMRDAGRATLGTNQLAPPVTQFVNAAAGDLHLKDTATDALDKGTMRADLTDDIDGEPRASATPDLGADER
ncbi:MAG TPA: hypothetical protein VIV11_26680 [Kofleriaceae bacterium]